MKLKFYIKSLKVYLWHKLGRPIPFILIIEITRRCNLKCPYCRRINLSKGKELTTDKVFSLIDNAKRIGIPWVTITGGEPLIRKDICLIGKKIKENGMIANLNTNGTLITKHMAKNLIGSFNFIKVSLNSKSILTKRKIIKGLHNLLMFRSGSKVKIGLSFIINRQNFDKTGCLTTKLKKSVDFITFQPQHSKITRKAYYSPEFATKWQKAVKEGKVNDLKVFVSAYGKRNKCDAGNLYLYVHPNGKVFGCPKASLYLGNLNTSSLENMLKHKDEQKLKRKRENCKGCFLKCTQEVSSVFNMPIVQLAKNLKDLIKVY